MSQSNQQQGLVSTLMIILSLAILGAILSILSGCTGFQQANGGPRATTATSTELVEIVDGRLEGSYQLEASIDLNGHEVYLINVPYEATRLKVTLAGEFVLLEVLDRGNASLIIRESGLDVLNLPGKLR